MSLFGNANTNASPFATFGQAKSQPQQSGGLFGSAPTISQPQQGGGLFGAPLTSQPQQSSGAFGSALGGATNTPPQQNSSPFGGLGQNTQQTGGSVFGRDANATKPAFSLGGNSTTQIQPKTSLFGTPSTTQAPQTTSLFGASTAALNPQQTSLFGSSLSRPGGLTMGQNNSNLQQQQQQTVPGVKIDVSNLRGTTRFNDLHEELQKQIEQIDAFIQQQIAFKEQCDAIMPSHGDNVSTISTDVDFLHAKLETTELALENDSAAIEHNKVLVQRDAEDARLSFRVIENLKLPQQFHYTGMWQQQQQQNTSGNSSSPVASKTTRTNTATSPNDDSKTDTSTDILSLFHTSASQFSKTLNTYVSQLGEIERHLGTLETSVVQQSQQALFRRNKDGTEARGKEDQIRELAAVLREFETAILGVAERVGSVRESAGLMVGAGSRRDSRAGIVASRWGR